MLRPNDNDTTRNGHCTLRPDAARSVPTMSSMIEIQSFPVTPVTPKTPITPTIKLQHIYYTMKTTLIKVLSLVMAFFCLTNIYAQNTAPVSIIPQPLKMETKA